MDKSIFHIENIQRLEVSDDDILVVKVSSKITSKVMIDIRNNLCKILGDKAKVIVIDEEIQSLSILSKKKLLKDLVKE